MKNEKMAVFRLTKEIGEPLSVMIATRHTKRKELTFYDEEKNEVRSLRYSTNQKSIFEDEQKGEVILAPIIIENGVYTVSERNPVLLKFMRMHPDNVSNKGSVFYEMDHEAEAKVQQLQMDVEDRAIDLYRTLNIDEIEAVHRQFSRNTDKLTSEEIKRDVRVFARNNAADFLEMVDSESVSMDGEIANMITENIIQFRNNKTQVHYNLNGNKRMLFRVPNGENPETALTEFLLNTLDGNIIYEDLVKELARLK